MSANTPATDFGPSTQQSDGSSSRESLRIGTRLGGYQIVDVLGRSVFSVVYLALDSSLQRQVAIKEYLPSRLVTRRRGQQLAVRPGSEAAYAAGLAAFLEEAKVLARFDHPSLARVLTFWEENDTAYTVMPYYEGHTLAAVLKAQPQPPDETWLRALLTPLLAALGVLHAAQCYHRNISPDNIVLLADGRPVLLDFGAANLVVGDKPPGLAAQFDLTYAPIEQASDAVRLPQGPWTDLYALAGVLQFAISGKTPQPASARLGVDPRRPLADTVLGLSVRFPDLHYSDSFLSAIDKALAVKPRDRPRSVADFQQLLDGPLPVAPAPAPPEPPSPPEPPPAAPMPQDKRSEPVLAAPSAPEHWFSAEPRARSTPPSRRGVLWLAALCVAGLLAAGAWWWTQQIPAPSFTHLPLPAEATSPAVTAPPVEAAPAPVAQASAVAELPSTASSAAPPASEVATSTPPLAAAPAAAASIAEPTPPPAPLAAAADPRPEPPPEPKTAKTKAAAEPANPRAACGSRSNFSLFYCMQTQCKRARFAQHPQCLDLKRRGEVN